MPWRRILSLASAVPMTLQQLHREAARPVSLSCGRIATFYTFHWDLALGNKASARVNLIAEATKTKL